MSVRCTRRSHQATVFFCLAMLDQREYLLNVPGLHGKYKEMFGRITVQAVLKPLLGNLSKLHLTIAKYHQTLTLTILPDRQILLLGVSKKDSIMISTPSRP